MKRMQRLGLVSSALLVLASQAFAQSVFVDGAAFASIERRNTYDSEPYPIYGVAQDPNGTVAGGSAAVGVWLTPTVSVRFEVALPAQLETSVEQGYPIPALSEIGLPYPGYGYSSELRERTRTFSPLLAWHTARWHGVQWGFLGGAAFVVRTQRMIDDTVYPLYLAPVPNIGRPAAITVPSQRGETAITTYGVTAQVGLDADIAIGGRLSVVPQVRAVGFDGGVSIRPGVGVRIRF